MSCIVELPLLLGSQGATRRVVFVEVVGEFSVEQIGGPSPTRPTCRLRTRVGDWVIDGSAEKVTALIASVKGLNSIRVVRGMSDGSESIGHRKVVYGDEPSLDK